MIMEIITFLVLLICAGLFLWTLYNEWVDIVERLKILHMVENFLLLLWDNPKHLLTLSNDSSNSDAMLELMQKAEIHQKKKSQLSELKKTVKLMNKEHETLKKLVGQVKAFK